MTGSCIDIRQTFIGVTGIARDFSITNQIWYMCNELCTAGALVQINSTNKVTISHESEISQYLGVFNKLPLKVRFHNT